MVLRGLVSAYDDLHRPGRIAAAAEAHAQLNAAAPTLDQARGAGAGHGRRTVNSTLAGKCARVALGRGCDVVVTEDWREKQVAAEVEGEAAQSEVQSEAQPEAQPEAQTEAQSEAHEFACIRPEDLPSLDETDRVSAVFSKVFLK